MKLKITFEITEAELAKALLPSGGKISSIEIEDSPKKRTRRTKAEIQAEERSPKRQASTKRAKT